MIRRAFSLLKRVYNETSSEYNSENFTYLRSSSNLDYYLYVD